MNIRCYRCQGTGLLRHYKHVCGGVCFACKGSGRAVSLDNKGPDQPVPNPLLPCKECSGEPTYVYSLGEYRGVKCTKCTNRTPMLGYTCKQHARNKWNKLNQLEG